MSRFLYNLSLDDWEQFKVQREAGETAHWRVKEFVIEPRSAEYLKHQMDDRDTGLGTFTGLYYRAEHPAYAGRVETAYDWHPGKTREWLPMMSDTKAEVTDHFEFLDKCAFPGQEDVAVLITGLGLGMVAEAALRMGVGHVTVVDNDPEVIELIAGQIDHPNLRIVQADAFAWEPDRKFDLAWHDIWPTISPDNQLREGASTMSHPEHKCWNCGLPIGPDDPEVEVNETERARAKEAVRTRQARQVKDAGTNKRYRHPTYEDCARAEAKAARL